MDMAQQLNAALNGHEVTNEEGDIVEGETTKEESLPQETTPVEEVAEVESTEDEAKEESKPSKEESEKDLATDEAGKRYVPEKRFKEVYGKAKATERELAALKKANSSNILQQTGSKPKSDKSAPKIDKADVLELKMTLPQFNPGNSDYSKDLDTLGFQILRANPGITPLEAGYQALDLAKNLSDKEVGIKEEARTVKTQQSDQGIASRVVSRKSTTPDVDSMSSDEMEVYMKQNGMW